MVNLKPYHWHTNNTICSVWIERDRAMVRLMDTRGKEIICLWDDEVGQFVVDGFKKRNQTWHDALCEYATAMKLRTKRNTK
jgi:hypothetical protein